MSTQCMWPFHTIIPAFVAKHGEPFMSFGRMGGAMQPQGHVQVLVNIIDFGMDADCRGTQRGLTMMGASQAGVDEDLLVRCSLSPVCPLRLLRRSGPWDIVSRWMARARPLADIRPLCGYPMASM